MDDNFTYEEVTHLLRLTRMGYFFWLNDRNDTISSENKLLNIFITF